MLVGEGQSVDLEPRRLLKVAVEGEAASVRGQLVVDRLADLAAPVEQQATAGGRCRRWLRRGTVSGAPLAAALRADRSVTLLEPLSSRTVRSACWR